MTQYQYKRGVLCTGQTSCDANLPVNYTVAITRLLSRNVVTVPFWPLMFDLSVVITIVQIFTSQQKHSDCGFSSTKKQSASKTLHTCKPSVDHTASQVVGAAAWASFRQFAQKYVLVLAHRYAHRHGVLI
jgi:hypothetical protein